MLIATRKAGECIICGVGEATVRVWVLSISGNRVKLGIEGPQAIAVYRAEVSAPPNSSGALISPTLCLNNNENVPQQVNANDSTENGRTSRTGDDGV